MSRVGNKKIKLPSGVAVKINSSFLEVVGAKGALKLNTFGRISLLQEGEEISVTPIDPIEGKPYWGLYRTLLANMVQGVSTGFSKSLEVQGTGYRASMNGPVLNLTVGYSHPVNLTPPKGVSFDVDKAGKIIVSGIDKELVGQVAAKIRQIRPAEPYKGKGIRYLGEQIKTKVGKSAGKKS